MVFFFALAAKEVFEATLPGGPLASPRRALSPYYVLAGLLLGKPIGILLFSYIARLAGASLPPGLRLGDLMVVGVAASIGFTVALFFATAAFPGGTALAETKMGALLSFAAAPIAIVVARMVGITGLRNSRRPLMSAIVSMETRRA